MSAPEVARARKLLGLMTQQELLWLESLTPIQRDVWLQKHRAALVERNAAAKRKMAGTTFQACGRQGGQ